MGTHAGSVMTLANSIIGVSVLAMPFCFKQCGIILSIVMLLLSNIVTRLACYYLIKSAIMEKRKNFEMLAFRVLGPTGKLIVELCIIGFMLGTCVAFFVVVGDLGPPILAEVLGVDHPSALRPSILIGLGVFVVLPLGLLRNVESLSTLCAASICFYVCLVLKVMGEATSHLLAWDWMDKVTFWRPAGVLQCIPIFSMALSCQTQLFEVFDSLPSTPMDRMYSVVRSAINMTTSFYIAVGFFGYVAFCNQPFTGNLLINFSPSVVSFIIKLGFVLSVAVSFPLVIFPCRASIYSLLFSKGHLGQSEGSSHIPETKFQCITLLIVTASLVTGLLVPSIELVLGFVGSTIGVFICIILPSVIFICLSSKNTNERLLAKILAGAGLLTMVLSTYANLYSSTEVVTEPAVVPLADVKVPNLEPQLPLLPKEIPLLPMKEKFEEDKKLKVENVIKKLDLSKVEMPQLKIELPLKLELPKEEKRVTESGKSRREPPNPIPEEPKRPPKKKPTLLFSKLEEELKSKQILPLEEAPDPKEPQKEAKANQKDVTGDKGTVGETKEDAKTKEAKEAKRETVKKLVLPKSVEVKPEDIVDTVKEPVKKETRKEEENDAKPKIEEVVKESKLKGSLAESVANGVPLPLAIKGKLEGIEGKEEKREKRDIELMIEKDPQDKAILEDGEHGSFVKTLESEVKSKSDDKKCSQNEAAQKEGNEDTKKQEAELPLRESKPPVKDTISQSDSKKQTELLENSPMKENKESLHLTKKDDSIMNKPKESKANTPIPREDELIKTPSYLSLPNLVLDLNPEAVSGSLKRELKAIDSIKEKRIEHR